MSLAALKVNGDLEELDEIASHLPYRLSRKFVMGPGMWVKTLTCTKHIKLYTNINCGLGLIEKAIAIGLNKIIAKICGFKRNVIKNNDYTS